MNHDIAKNLRGRNLRGYREGYVEFIQDPRRNLNSVLKRGRTAARLRHEHFVGIEGLCGKGFNAKRADRLSAHCTMRVKNRSGLGACDFDIEGKFSRCSRRHPRIDPNTELCPADKALAQPLAQFTWVSSALPHLADHFARRFTARLNEERKHWIDARGKREPEGQISS